MSELQLAIPLFIAAQAAIALTVVGVRRRGVPGSAPFAVLMAAAAWSSFAVAMSLLADSAESKFVWLRIQYLGAAFVPGAWIALVLQFRRRQPTLPDRLVGLLSVEPIIALALEWTNGVHGLMWGQAILDATGPMLVLVVEDGVLFWLHHLYALAMVGVGGGLLVVDIRQREAALRRQATVVAAAGGVMGLGSLVSALGWVPFSLDGAPLATLVAGAAIGAALFRYRLLSLIPIALDAVMEGMTEGAVILADGGHVVDMNPAAERMTGVGVDQSVGMYAPDLLGQFGDVGAGVGLPYVNFADVTGPNGMRYYELHMTRLYKAETKSRGRLVVVRDVTPQKESEAELHLTVDRLEEEFERQTTELTQELQERKFAEIALRDSEERSRQVVDTAYDALIAMNANGAIIDWNPRANDVFGGEPEEAMGNDFSKLLLPSRAREDHRRGAALFLGERGVAAAGPAR